MVADIGFDTEEWRERQERFRRAGWIHSHIVEYNSGSFDDVLDWCRERFDKTDFTFAGRRFWFRDGAKFAMFLLRWA